jgi:predicted ATPase
MITIKEIKERPAKVYHNDTFIGEITDQYQLNDIRIQVGKNQIEGVYFLFDIGNGVIHQINLDKYGQPDTWPNGFFDLMEYQLFEILDMNRKKVTL